MGWGGVNPKVIQPTNEPGEGKGAVGEEGEGEGWGRGRGVGWGGEVGRGQGGAGGGRCGVWGRVWGKGRWEGKVVWGVVVGAGELPQHHQTTNQLGKVGHQPVGEGGIAQ